MLQLKEAPVLVAVQHPWLQGVLLDKLVVPLLGGPYVRYNSHSQAVLWEHHIHTHRV